MAHTYLAGEKKIRPGVYFRTSKNSSETVVGALNGVVALVMAATWGPTDKVTKHENADSIRVAYGNGAGVEAACKILEAGANTLYIKRLDGAKGGEGSVGTVDIGTVARLNAKYQGSRTLSAIVRAKAGDATKKQLIITEGTTRLETLEFAANETDETAAFIKVVADSEYITAEKLAEGVIAEGDYELKGTDPTITTADYADAYYALEPYNYNVLVTDSIDADVFATLCAYEEESYDNGKLIMVVGGDTPDTELDTRLTRAAACNSERVVFFGSSYVDKDGNIIKGVPAIAYAAGFIASTPSNRSIVHGVVNGATDVPEKLTNAQYVDAIKNGLLLLSVGPDNQVWFDSGINTLIIPDEDQDEGWKKIRRVKTRYELMDRINRTLEPKVGRINCDTDGISYIIQCAGEIIKAMVSEGKLYSGTFYEDPENPHVGDSAWFIIEVDDIDSLEKIYLHYKFRYSAE